MKPDALPSAAAERCAHAPLAVAVPTALFASTQLAAQTPVDSVIVLRGAPVPVGAAIAVAQLIAAARNHIARVVIVEGLVTRACTRPGCGMQVALTEEAHATRVSFRDDEFLIPQSVVGRRVCMDGVAKVTTHAEASADHLIGECTQRHRTANITATDVDFVASGVELHRK